MSAKEIIFDERGYFHCHAARENDLRLIRNKTRRGNDHLITRIKDRNKGEIERL